MRLLAVGVSHRTAPVELRECLDFAKEGLDAAVAELLGVLWILGIDIDRALGDIVRNARGLPRSNQSRCSRDDRSAK